MIRSRFLLLLVVSTTSVSCYSQRYHCPEIPGTVKVDKTYSIRATEITVREYMEFIAGNNFDQRLYPDSSLLQLLPSKILFDDLLKQKDFKYFRRIKGGNYDDGRLIIKKQKTKSETNRIRLLSFLPITAISYDQAIQYCKWLENKMNRLAHSCQFHINLPSIEDYKFLLKNIDSTCIAGCIKNCPFNFNYYGMVCGTKSIIGVEKSTNKLVRADRFRCDSYGIYNLQGNAAEMTSTRNISMGGSYMQAARDSYNDVQLSYTKPELWLGFRFVTTRN